MNLQCSTEDRLYLKISTEVTDFMKDWLKIYSLKFHSKAKAELCYQVRENLSSLKVLDLGQSSVLLHLFWRKIHTPFNFNKGSVATVNY